jgi:hypothetical protein
MAFPVAVRSTGTLITASIWNADLKDNLNTLRAGGIALTSQATLDGFYASSSTQMARVALAARQSQRVNAGASAHEAFVAPQHYAMTVADVANTTTETTTASFTMPANEMSDGDVLLWILTVKAKNNKGSTGGIEYKWHWGATSVSAGTESYTDDATERNWILGFLMGRVGADFWVLRRITFDSLYDVFSAGYLALTTNTNVVTMTPTFSSSATVALKITLDAASASFYWKTQSARVIRFING